MGMASRVWHPICLLNTRWPAKNFLKRIVPVTAFAAASVLLVGGMIAALW